MSRDRPPVIKGRIPQSNERYNLDDPLKLKSLNLDPTIRSKIADEYDHYPDCKWAIIEYKSRNLRDSIEQLQETSERLSEVQRTIDMAIIVSKGMKAEKNIFQRKNGLLHYKLTGKPVWIQTGASNVEVQIYYLWEVDKQYEKYNRSLEPWVSK